ncbi:MAG: valine--tRNA ligase [Candidatus Paceibacterota bacterium]
MDLPKEFQSGYDHTDTEEPLYSQWEESGYFNPDICIDKGVTEKDSDPFSMVLPPLNVTGVMHVGHAAMTTIEDILIRFARMRGKRTLWIPGTDHAAIATQSKVEKILSKEGVRRSDLGREKFLERVEEFAQNSHSTIVSQLRSIGGSLDWSREAFTLDEKREKAVREAFKRMYDLGLIYRKDRVVNWDPKGQTTVSDDEVLHEESTGTLYTFRYSKDFPVPIATTRPETKVGDTAVAIHPDDKRYNEYIGTTHEVEFAGSQLSIQIIADESIDPEYGTGAVGITPAHSMTDWEIAERHDLPLKQVINEYGKMENVIEELEGMKTKDAREWVVEWIKENDLMENTEEVNINVSKAERSGGIIEPLPKLQWFIDVNKEFTLEHSEIEGIDSGSKVTLKQLMASVVKSGEVSIIPPRFEKVYFNWIDNLHDWCISRQIWYGHRIPVWYKGDEMHVGHEAPGDEWKQDPDTLDTWFSSGLWTFSTLGWPEKTDDLLTYHPNSLLETGYDIIFFWVARMILMSTCLLGEIPFKDVYFHGLVRDKKGQKISKSLGNNIDPVDIIEEHGADALRMALIIGTSPGNDANLDLDDVRGYRKFANKVWNIARFIFMNIPDEYNHSEKPDLSVKYQNYLTEIQEKAEEITEHLNNYRLHLAAEETYHYIWHRLADEILEESKDDLYSDNADIQQEAIWTLVELVSISLRLLHPIMPFVTEAIWKHMPTKERDFLMVENWPIEE